MTSLTKLFEPSKIGKMELRNRAVMAPMGTFSGDEDGSINGRTIDYHVERAKGPGLIICQYTYVCKEAPGGPGVLALWHDKYIPGLERLTKAVHQHGAKIALQIGHHGIQLADPVRQSSGGGEIDVVAPSAIPFIPTGGIPREASKGDIEYLEEAHAEAARRSKEAGFDAVELHAAHGKLPQQFMSPFFNKRTDEYGGSLENRGRFTCEIIQRIRLKLGPDFPILVRMDATEGFEGGYTIDEAVRFAQLFAKAGADAIDVTAGVHWYSVEIPSYLEPVGTLVPLAHTMKKALHVPVIVAWRLNLDLAEQVLQEDKADFVAFGRALLADPELLNKAKDERVEDIRPCIACCNCLDWGRMFERGEKTGRNVQCTVNPALLREKEFVFEPTKSPKKVMVVGGGLAGMQAAGLLAERGHTVEIYERENDLGGQWNIACCDEEKSEAYKPLKRYLVLRLNKTGVKVNLNTIVTSELVRRVNPDTVVLATGAVPATLDVPSADRESVVQAIDVIAGKVQVGERVVVIGGSYRGMEVAYSLAKQGKKVSLVTNRKLGRNEQGRDVNLWIYLSLRNKLIDIGVQLYPNCSVLEIRGNGVSVVSGNELLFFRADNVVLAVGAKSDRKLAEELSELVSEVYTVGDCVEPRTALEAMNEAAEIARQI